MGGKIRQSCHALTVNYQCIKSVEDILNRLVGNKLNPER